MSNSDIRVPNFLNSVAVSFHQVNKKKTTVKCTEAGDFWFCCFWMGFSWNQVPSTLDPNYDGFFF